MCILWQTELVLINELSSDSNNFQKIAAYCRRMELKFDLTQVLSPRRFLPKDQRQIPRQDARKEKLKIVFKVH